MARKTSVSAALSLLLFIIFFFFFPAISFASCEDPTSTSFLSADANSLQNQAGKVIVVGPWGSGNYSWYYRDNSDNPKLKGLRLGYSFGYKTIEFVFQNTTVGLSSANLSADYIHEYQLGDNEFITEISSHYERYQGEIVLTSLGIHNNVGGYQVYGPAPSSGDDYSLPIRSGNIVGFFGENHQYINSFGLYLEPTQNEEGNVLVGPWGGSDGTLYDVNDTTRVTKVDIYYGSLINSIAFEYVDKNGKSKISAKIGGNGGNLSEINLENNEYFSSLSGKYGYIGGNKTVTSLTFTSNLRQYGPYGDPQNGYYFSVPLVKGKIAGFFGWGGVYLNAIGAYLTY